MIYIKDLTIKQIVIITAVAVVFLATIGIYLYKVTTKEENYDMEELGLTDNFVGMESINKQIVIYVTGEVNNKGVVVLEEGARVIDAIESCGGETLDADLNKINLAYVLSDGDKLYVPSIKDKEEIEYITSESGNNVIEKGAGGKMSDKNSVVNINTATKEQLTTLNGIGEATAEKIILYRKENGKFNVAEDIKNVPGIGDSKYEAIKDKITV